SPARWACCCGWRCCWAWWPGAAIRPGPGWGWSAAVRCWRRWARSCNRRWPEGGAHVPELPPGHGMAAYLVRPGPRLRADGRVLLRRPVGVRPRDRPLGAAGHALRAAADALVRTGAAAGVRAPAAGSGPGRSDAPAGGRTDAGT